MPAHLAERGARVTLVCATDGEAGKAHPSVGPVDDLGARRIERSRHRGSPPRPVSPHLRFSSFSVLVSALEKRHTGQFGERGRDLFLKPTI
jgi:hypothetical protein